MIEIRGLRKRLGKKQVLDGIDLDIRTGETVVVLGPSGTGKSVLIKHILGLLAPDEGSIEIDGEEIVGRRESELNLVRRRFGMLFQQAALFDSMTVGENVALALREHGSMTEDQIQARVRERLEWVGLKADVDVSKPSSLSGGMRKRVGLARAIALDPDFVLYDEPTTGLDPITADVIDELIRGLQKRMGVTSIVVTHDLKSAFKVGDRMAMLYGGKVVFSGTAEELRTTRNPYVRQFMEGSGDGPIQPT
jgi:phospholipid/cholesterol/gamma-HCH transport system ATP-binding protein